MSERLSDYDYTLPEELIAQVPLEDRAGSRLLVLGKDGSVRHRMFRDCVELLQPGDLLVLNDTRVSALRLHGKRDTGGAVEALLLSELGDGRFEAMVRPAKRLKPGARVDFDGLCAVVEQDLGDGLKVLAFEATADLAQALEGIGSTPLPPYIHERLENRERYQTIYGRYAGSAAAPTAGLHFTEEVLDALREKGVGVAWVTLHVSLDTFRPVTVDDPNEHVMHGERCVMPPETVEAVERCTGRVIAVGTTTVRTLETFAVRRRGLEHGERLSRLFIRPGFEFRVVDGMFTNFHMPRTTMLLMISALAGKEAVLDAYAAAVVEKYRFLSFGDSMLIL
jgi:S-adenosylmethionine:tRNA ribosyltransferase-isomerase